MSSEQSVKIKVFKALSPKTWIDVKEGYNVGDVKQFPDGSTRRLDENALGVRRWFSIGKGDGKDPKQQDPNKSEGNTDPFGMEISKDITYPDWISFNQYLTEDNPFRNTSSYEEMCDIYMNNAYSIDKRKDMAKKDNNSAKVKDIEKQSKMLDNYFLATLMYKVSVLIENITKYEPMFDYKNFIKGKNWNDLIAYSQTIFEPQPVNYEELWA